MTPTDERDLLIAAIKGDPPSQRYADHAVGEAIVSAITMRQGLHLRPKDIDLALNVFFGDLRWQDTVDAPQYRRRMEHAIKAATKQRINSASLPTGHIH